MSDVNDVLTGSAAPRAEQEIAEPESTEQPADEVQAEAAEAATGPAAELVEAGEVLVEEEPAAEVAPMEEPAPEASAATPAAEVSIAEEPAAEVAPMEEPAAAASSIEEPSPEASAATPAAEVSTAEEPAQEIAAAASPAVAEAAPAPKAARPPRERRPAPAALGEEGVETTDASGQRVVRTLAVGQEVQGTVKRVSEFGAFVDIGVGRDGLVHISEISVRRIGKVTDVLNEGDKVTLWIKKLDRERNRISLTMISPGTRTMRDLQKDDVVPGTVTRLLPYGAFVDVGVGRDALLHVREMGERFVAKPEDVVKVGDVLDVRIIEIQRRRGRIDLSIKGLREEPEPEPVQQAGSGGAANAGRGADVQAAEPEPEVEDPYADVEPVSAMEAAWKKAVEATGGTYKPGKKGDKRDARDRRERQRQMQEEIMNRTLKQGK